VGGAAILRGLLNDRDFTVASNAAYALGLLRDSASVPALSAALSANARVAREAAWALGEIGAPARTAILSGLAVPGVDDARSIQLLLAAAKLRPIPVKELKPYLAMNARPHIQWAAAYAIARFRAPAGVRDLVTLGTNAQFLAPRTANAVAQNRAELTRGLPTADAYVDPAAGRQRARAEIARGLAKNAAGDSLGTMAFNVLLGLVGDPHPHVRINAVRSLATYGANARSALIGATRDADANVRIATAQSIGTVLDSVTAPWLRLWQNDTSLMYRSSLLASATRAGAHLPTLIEWTSHRDWRYRAAALAAIGASTDTPFVARTAKSMITDPDGRVRASAYGLLAGNDTAALPPAVHDALLGGLTDSDFYARATVIGNMIGHARARCHHGPYESWLAVFDLAVPALRKSRQCSGTTKGAAGFLTWTARQQRSMRCRRLHAQEGRQRGGAPSPDLAAQV
jgi:HEAT repeat protein